MKIPLLVVGPPGCAKTLSFSIAIDNMKGKQSSMLLYRFFHNAHPFRYHQTIFLLLPSPFLPSPPLPSPPLLTSSAFFFLSSFEDISAANNPPMLKWRPSITQPLTVRTPSSKRTPSPVMLVLSFYWTKLVCQKRSRCL